MTEEARLVSGFTEMFFTLFDDEDLLRMATILQEQHPEIYRYTPFWLRIFLYRRSCEELKEED